MLPQNQSFSARAGNAPSNFFTQQQVMTHTLPSFTQVRASPVPPQLVKPHGNQKKLKLKVSQTLRNGNGNGRDNDCSSTFYQRRSNNHSSEVTLGLEEHKQRDVAEVQAHLEAKLESIQGMFMD